MHLNENAKNVIKILNENDQSYFDDDMKEKTSFKMMENEYIVNVSSGIRWIENNSSGKLVITNMRLVYIPIFYSLPKTTDIIYISLDNISKLGFMSSFNRIIVYVNDNDSKLVFTSSNMLKLFKTYTYLKKVIKYHNKIH
jgi:hypothetical protein